MAIDPLPLGSPVFIVGAGPVGLFLALRLVLANISVTIIEAEERLSDATKALTHMPTIFPELKRAGVLEDVLTAAGSLRSQRARFRRGSDKSVITELPLPPGKPGPCLLPQSRFSKVLLDHLEQYPDRAKILFAHRFVSMQECLDETKISVHSLHDGLQKVFHASFVIGADGAKSAVRRATGIKMEGETLPFQLVATDIRYPFEEFGWDGQTANFVADPVDYGLITPIDGEGRWRCSFGLPLKKGDVGTRKQGLSAQEIAKEVKGKFEKMLPCADGEVPTGWQILNVAPYKAQQLCAETMRKGSVVLVGDAAHRRYLGMLPKTILTEAIVTNPYAGMGLNTGLFDAASLADALISIIQHDAARELLDRWAQARRNSYLKMVDPISRAAFWSFQDPDVESLPQRHPLLKAIKGAGPGAKPPDLMTDVSTFEEYR